MRGYSWYAEWWGFVVERLGRFLFHSSIHPFIHSSTLVSVLRIGMYIYRERKVDGGGRTR